MRNQDKYFSDLRLLVELKGVMEPVVNYWLSG
jgi:hypothetical protein